jgi:PPM family protein phosphatase
VDARSLRIEVAATTSTGRRKINADAFLVDQAAGLFAVADGMGDEERSALVARMALDAVRERFGPPSLQQPLAKWTADEAAERFRRGVMAANERVRALAGGEPPPIGTTFAGVVVCGDCLCIAHVGDSRVYLVRATGKPARLTDDHTVLAELLWWGVASGVAFEEPEAHALTRTIGTGPVVEVDPFAVRWKPGDMILVCTDGVSDRVSAEMMGDVLAGTTGVEVAARRLMEAASEAGGFDNATAVVLRNVGYDGAPARAGPAPLNGPTFTVVPQPQRAAGLAGPVAFTQDRIAHAIRRTTCLRCSQRHAPSSIRFNTCTPHTPAPAAAGRRARTRSSWIAPRSPTASAAGPRAATPRCWSSPSCARPSHVQNAASRNRRP